MPGTLMLDAYEMSISDALAILLAGEFQHDAHPHEIDELCEAARSIVEAHAAEVGIWPVAGFAFTSLYAPPWQVEQPDVIPAWFIVHVVKLVVLEWHDSHAAEVGM